MAWTRRKWAGSRSRSKPMDRIAHIPVEMEMEIEESARRHDTNPPRPIPLAPRNGKPPQRQQVRGIKEEQASSNATQERSDPIPCPARPTPSVVESFGEEVACWFQPERRHEMDVSHVCISLDGLLPARLPRRGGQGHTDLDDPSTTLLQRVRAHLPTSTQVAGLLTLLIAGAALLVLAGLTLTAAVVALVFLGPMALLTSRICVTFGFVLLLVAAAALCVSGFAVAAFAAVTWAYRQLTP
ncbi:hypothetical protein ZWY2020_024585 [Hordeum vulgare]|nr:hypothetical protein ZWY2020_024585 [Hordeum vulgare]